MFARFAKPIVLTLGSVVLSICLASDARADFLFSWDFTNSGTTIAPNDTFAARAVIRNNSTGGEILRGSDIEGYGAGLLASSIGTFGYSFGSSGNLYSEFAGLALRPGESYEFTYFTFDHTGALELGSRHGLEFAFLSANGHGQMSAGTLPFEFFVGASGQGGEIGGDVVVPPTFGGLSAPVAFGDGTNNGPGTIPEPVTLLLFGLGLSAAVRRRVR
jgi:hypothetical protein